MIDPDSTVSCRSLALEHAEHWRRFFIKELLRARIREAPQLPVIGQISWPFGNPRSEQEVEIPGLVVVPESAVTDIADETLHIKRKPFQRLRATRT